MPTQIANVIREYLLKYPLHSKKSIAKLLHKEHPMLFSNSEHARKTVRYYTGTSGYRDRKYKTAYYDELRKPI